MLAGQGYVTTNQREARTDLLTSMPSGARYLSNAEYRYIASIATRKRG
jgi:hypothetical protein